MGNLDVRPNEPQAQGTRDRGDDSRAATAQHINDKYVVEDRGDRLHETVDARVQRNIRDSQRAEESRRIVVDSRSTGEILQGEGAEDEYDAVAHALTRELLHSTAVEGPLSRPIRGRNGRLFVKPILDSGDVLLDVGVVDGEVAQPLKRLVRLLGPALAHEPQRALVQEEGADEERHGGDELHGHGDAEGGGAVGGDVLRDAVVDPEADERPDLVGDLEQPRQDAADRRDRQLGDVARHRRRDRAAPQPRQDPPRVHHAEVAARRRHQHRPDDEHRHARLQRPLAPDPLRDEEAEQGAH